MQSNEIRSTTPARTRILLILMALQGRCKECSEFTVVLAVNEHLNLYHIDNIWRDLPLGNSFR